MNQSKAAIQTDVGHFRYTLQQLASDPNLKVVQFAIPLYQRLYAWDERQIRQLLIDMMTAYERSQGNTKSNKEYYLGNVVLARKATEESKYDLVDGQQRMTTLWLLACCFYIRLPAQRSLWAQVLHTAMGAHQLRLYFDIRQPENEFLARLLKIDTLDTRIVDATLAAKDAKANDRMVAAIRNITTYLDEIGDERKEEEFSTYVYSRVRLVATILPRGVQLTKYFERMNDRGEQLEKHEILKARLLRQVSADKELSFVLSRAWDSCAQMGGYIEDQFSAVEKITALHGILALDIENCNRDRGQLIKTLLPVFGEKTNIVTESSEFSLIDLIPKPGNLESLIEKGNLRPYVNTYRSIVRFPEFLLHTLKVFLARHRNLNKNDTLDVRVKDSALLEQFGKHLPESDYVKFIVFLLRSRILFDTYIIKYTDFTDPQKTQHRIHELTDVNGSWTRQSHLRSKRLAMLQGMLNVAVEPEHWISPLLAKLHSIENLDVTQRNVLGNSFEMVYQWLDTHDRHLAVSRIMGDVLMDAANHALANAGRPLLQQEINKWNLRKLLRIRLNKGTATERYWFFRLDLELWKKWTDHCQAHARRSNEPRCLTLKLGRQERLHSAIEKFQFRQNRSVEHFYPQNRSMWTSKRLHGFGNLALISVESNSSFSDDTPNIKANEIEKKINAYAQIESIKLAWMAAEGIVGETWNPTIAGHHGMECLTIIWSWLASNSNMEGMDASAGR